MVVINDCKERILPIRHNKGKLYVLDEGSHQALNTTKDLAKHWYPNLNMLRTLNSWNVISISSWTNKSSICASCQMQKGCKLPFIFSSKIFNVPLAKMHCDFMGFYCYYLFSKSSVLCYFRRWIFQDLHGYFIYKKKYEYFECFVKFHKLVENQFTHCIKIFQSDGGGEFKFMSFKNYLSM